MGFRTRVLLLSLAIVCPPAQVQARIIVLTAALSTENGTPQTSMPGYGAGRFIFDDQSNLLQYSLTFDALTTPLLAVDIHGPGGMQSSAPAIAKLAIEDDPVHEGPYRGSLTLTPEQGAALLAGQLYIDIHTDLYRDGEIRGQIRP